MDDRYLIRGNLIKAINGNIWILLFIGHNWQSVSVLTDVNQSVNYWGFLKNWNGNKSYVSDDRRRFWVVEFESPSELASGRIDWRSLLTHSIEIQQFLLCKSGIVAVVHGTTAEIPFPLFALHPWNTSKISISINFSRCRKINIF